MPELSVWLKAILILSISGKVSEPMSGVFSGPA